jgi:PKD repeat protein
LGSIGIASAQADLAINPPSSTVAVDDTFTLTVQVVSSGQSYSAAEVYLTFDPALLEVVSLTPQTSVLGIPLPPAAFDNTTGTIGYGAGTFSNFPSATSDLLQIEFRALAQGTATISFSPEDFDPNTVGTTNIAFEGINVLGTSTGASVTVGSSNIEPVAAFTFLPTNPQTNEVVNFDASSSLDSDGTIISYEWNYGDGNTGTGINPQHSYTASGTYTVSLTVTDDQNAVDVATQQITVSTTSVTQFTITATAGANGAINPSGSVSVTAGESQLFTFLPDPGYEVAEILVNGSPVALSASYEFTGVQADQSISVSFAEVPPFQLCIASGSGDLTAFGRAFVGDPQDTPPTGLGFTRTNGKLYGGYNGAIAGTAPGSGEELLFQKEIYGGAGGTNPSFTYDIPVANGTYMVDLYFAEVFQTASAARVFDVILDGNRILDEYDMLNPVKDGIGTAAAAITRTYYVQVTDGTLSLQIGDATVDNGKLSGICVTAAPGANLHPISTVGNLIADAGVATGLPLNISDPENDVLSVTLNGLPASLSYNPASGQLEGTPLAGDAGVYTINAIISDGTSAPVTEEFTLTINPPAGDDPPAIAAIADVFANEGDAISVPVVVTDDNNPAATIEIFDVSAGGTNPFTPTTTVAVGSLTDNGGGNYIFTWTPAAGEGKSYLAVVTANDGVNLPVTEAFRIHVAQPIPATILARTFFNPEPWYGSSPPQAPYTLAIETSTAKNIGYIDNNDFVEYLINVPAAGVYDLEVQAAKGSTGTTTVTFSEESGGSFAPIGTVGVPGTQGAWQSYAPYSTQVSFSAPGVQVLRLDFNGGVNISEFTFSSTGGAAPAIAIGGPAEKSVPEGGSLTIPVTLTDADGDNLTLTVTSISNEPQLLESGNTTIQRDPFPFDASGFLVVNNEVDTPGNYTADLVFTPVFGDGGGANGDGNGQYSITVAVSDGTVTTQEVFTVTVTDTPQPISASAVTRLEAESFDNQGPANAGSGSNGIGVEVNNPGVTNIGFTHNGDFAEYQIEVAQAGTYQFTFAVAKGSGPAGSVTINGGPEAIAVNSPTGGWQTYVDFTVEKALAAGVQTLRLDWISAQTGFLFNIDYIDVELLSNDTPVVAITAPADNASVTRGVSTTLTGTASDTEDGDLTSSLQWTSSDSQFLADGNGGNTSATFITPGAQTLRASVTDSDGNTGFEEITVNVSAPAVSFVTPLEGASLSSLTVNVEVSTTDVLFGNAEHFHVYINPADPANLVSDTRISTATPSAPWKLSDTQFVFDENSGALSSNGLGNGIVEGENTLIIVAARQDHEEFTNPEARATVTFEVCLADITLVEATNPSDCGLEDGSLVVIATGSNLQYSIDNGVTFQASNTFTGLGAGTYDIVVQSTVNASCQDTDQVTLTAPTAPSITELSGTDPTGCTTDDGSIQITATGTSLEYSIDGGTSYVQNGGSFTGLADGTYNIVVREVGSSGCSASDQVVLTDPAGPFPVISGPLTYLQGTPGVTLDAGDGFTSYLWSTGATTRTINATAGTYSVTVTDANGCEGTSVDVIVTEDADTTAPIAVCQNIEVFLDASGQASLTAADLDGGSSDNVGIDTFTASITTFDCSNLGPNQVMLTVTDVNGNSDFCMATVTVTDPLPPVLTCAANVIATSSNGNPVVVTVPVPGVADNCGEDLNPVGVRDDGLGLNDPFPVGITTVTWTAVDASGNPGTCLQNVTVNFTASVENDIVSFVVPNQEGTSEIDPLAHTVTVVMPSGTDLSNLTPVIGISANATIDPPSGQANDFSQPLIYTVTAQNGSEQDWEVTITAQPGAEANLVIAPASMEVTLFADQTAQVSYTVDSEDGSTLPTPAAMSITDDATGTPATWAATTSAANQGTPYEVIFNSTGLTPGTYTGVLEAGPVTGYTNASIPITLIVEPADPLDILQFVLVDADTDTDLFVLTDGLQIPISSLPTLNLNIRAEAGPQTASVRLQLSGALAKTQVESFAPYALYGDINGDYNPQAFVLGNYTIQATAFSGSSATGTPGASSSIAFSLTDQDPACATFNASLASSANPTTCSGADGSASIGVSGATGSVTYQWSHDGSLTGNTATGLTAGSYTVTVSDSNGCTDLVTFTLTDPAGPAVSLAPFVTVLDTDAPFALGGGSPAGGTYSGTGVSGGSFDPSVGPGTYAITYTYTDGNGCSGSATQNLVVTSELGDAVLIVLDATTDTELFALTDGLQILKSEIGNTPLGVIYNANLNPGGVQFNLTGPLTQSRFEGPAPHSLFGDIGVDIQGQPFPVGNYTLVADPVNGPTITVNFSVVEQTLAAKSAPVLPMTASPNPANEEVTMVLEEPARIDSFHIYDASGRLVKVLRASAYGDLRSYNLNVLDLPIGMYYVMATDAEGNQYQEQILVSRF